MSKMYMQKYQATYLKNIGLNPKDDDVIKNIRSELSHKRAIDIHHIKFLMNGVERQDYPFERLIALDREEHTKFGDKRQYYDYLLWMHYIFIHELNNKGIKSTFETEWFPNCIFDWESDDTTIHDNMFDFYDRIRERRFYTEIWEMPDHCILEVYNFAGNKINTIRRPTKFEIFEKPIKQLAGSQFRYSD